MYRGNFVVLSGVGCRDTRVPVMARGGGGEWSLVTWVVKARWGALAAHCAGAVVSEGVCFACYSTDNQVP